MQKQQIVQTFAPRKIPSIFKQSNLQTSSNVNVRASQIFYTIADESMSQYFMNYIQQQQEEQAQNDKQNTKIQHQLKDNSPQKLDQSVTQNFKFPQSPNQIVERVQLAEETEQIRPQIAMNQVVSRLQIQIKKNNLNFIPVYGQMFIRLVDAELLAHSSLKNEKGLLLVTNYRFSFFKGKIKKLDLPFGFISECKLNDKNNQIVVHLKYQLFWKLKVEDQKQYNTIKIILQIYLKIQSIKSCFAFSYAHKYPDTNKIKHNQIINQFVRLGLPLNKDLEIVDNTRFQLCNSYPEIFYGPIRISSVALGKIARFWNERRFPAIVYQNLTGSAHYFGTIWRSSCIICDRTEQLKDVAKLLDYIKKDNQKLIVFDAGSKNIRKGLQQFQINSQCQMKYLDIQSLQYIKLSYLAIVQCFLSGKKTFIKDVLSSRWYNEVMQYLKGALQISERVQNHKNVLVKCYDGKDKSTVLSALAQIILNPFYRSFNGFSVLVQKQFQHFGHPFLNRLGLTNDKNQQIPIFIMFLDCVSQLIHTNQMCFQFNYKFLSKLSNLMYTCLFGTFITNTRKQAMENNISTETVPIWNQLISQLTMNSYYFQKTGLLQVPVNLDGIRIWKQHFWYLTTPPKQSYKIHPLAQDNLDYVNLNCHKVMDQNVNLQNQISNQKKIIDSLKARIQAQNDKNNKNQETSINQ